MKPWIFPGCVILSVVICAGTIAGCGGRSSPAPTGVCIETPPSPPFEEGFPCARQTLIAAATAGLVPEGLIIATKTPDLMEAMSQDDTMRTLRAAGLGPLLDAIDHSDPDALLSQFDWTIWNCGGRGDDGCPPGVAIGTGEPKIDTGGDTFYVSAETVRPYLTFLMTGPPLQLVFVSRSKSQPDRYILGFAGPIKGPGFLPLASDDTDLAWMFVRVSTTHARPIQHFDVGGEPVRTANGVPTPAGRACEATNYAYDSVYGDPDQQIVLFDNC